MLKSKKIDMLHGPVWNKLIIFAIPLAFTSMLQQLYNTADIAILGQFEGTNAMAAVGNNISFIGILINLFLGLSLGANVIIARFIGAKQSYKVEDAVRTAFYLALLSGGFLTVFGELITDSVNSWLEVPPEVEDMAELYLRVYLLGMPVMSLYDFEAAILRANGDTRTPLVALAIASLANILMNLAFVAIGWGVAGVALSTVLANVISAGILFKTLTTTDSVLRLRLTPVRMNLGMLKNIVKIGLPAGIQGMVFCLSNIMIQAAINSLGADTMAASAAAFTIEINVYCFMSAFAQATTTFVSQNYGAGNLPRCFSITRTGLSLAIAFTFAIAALVLFFADQALGFFSSEPNVIELGKIRLWYIVAPEFLQAFTDIFSGALRGYGLSLAPAMYTLLGICGVRITWLYTVFPLHPSFDVLMGCYSFSWLMSGIFIILLYRKFTKKLRGQRILK